MYELHDGARSSARHLFDSLDHHLAVRGILEGTVAARVHADHLRHPQSVFAWTGHRLFLAGSAENQEFNEDIRRFIATTVYPQASNVGNHMAKDAGGPGGLTYSCFGSVRGRGRMSPGTGRHDAFEPVSAPGYRLKGKEP